MPLTDSHTPLCPEYKSALRHHPVQSIEDLLCSVSFRSTDREPAFQSRTLAMQENSNSVEELIHKRPRIYLQLLGRILHHRVGQYSQPRV